MIPDRIGKGTSSTRAVNAAKSEAASSRWGDAARGDYLPRAPSPPDVPGPEHSKPAAQNVFPVVLG